jgi:hypothetical protein
MTTYFGLCDSSGVATGSASDNNGGNAATVWNNTAVKVFTCPGSGSQTINEITSDLKLISGTDNVRCAVYSSDGSTLIAQGSAAVALSGASDSWQGHIGQANITPNPATLTGGTSYILVVSTNGTSGTAGTDHADSTANSMKFDTTDRTTGYSGALPAGTTANPIWPVRVGLADAAPPSGVSIAWVKG